MSRQNLLRNGVIRVFYLRGLFLGNMFLPNHVEYPRFLNSIKWYILYLIVIKKDQNLFFFFSYKC